jgi:hypothetical protein
MVWENALEKIQSSISENGYFYWQKSFVDFVKEYKIKANQKAPFYLSLDFYSQQRPELTKRGLYVVRLGRGNFGIFDQRVFPKPYLELNEKEAMPLSSKYPSKYKAMRQAFRIVDEDLSSAEDTLLELCRFHGIFNKMLETFGEDNYQIGPRGLFTSRFPILFKKKGNEPIKFNYNGQVELDYSVWMENRVLVFEAKSLTKGGFDIGWHKLAYPSQKFYVNFHDNLSINPVYLLRKRDSTCNRILIYLFPEIIFERGSVILNDEKYWKPLRIWSIDMNLLSV